MAYKNIDDSSMKVMYGSISAIRFRTTEKGNLPQFSYIFCMPEPMGTEFKKVAYYFIGALLFIELQRGKEWNKHINYQKDPGSTATCTNIMM